MLDLALLIVACGLGTYLWRGLGLLISGRLRMDSAFFAWAGCVAYAMIAGLTARIIEGGQIGVGDPVSFIDLSPPPAVSQ